MAVRSWTPLLIVSLLFAVAWAVWSGSEMKSLYRAFETTRHAVRTPPYRSTTHMLYESPRGDLILVNPMQGEDALTYAKRSRLLVNVLLQGGDPGVNQKCSTWNTPEGGRVTVCVTREPGETREAWCNRFDAIVEAFRKTFPCER